MDRALAMHKHLEWSTRLAKYVESMDTSLDPELVGDCRKCALGQALQRQQESGEESAAFSELRVEHKAFHLLAADVVRHVHKGDAAAAQALLRGEFKEQSRRTIRALERFAPQDGTQESTQLSGAERLFALLGAIDDAVLFVNAQKEVEIINDKFCRTFAIPFTPRVESADVQRRVLEAMEDPTRFRALLRAWYRALEAPAESEVRLKNGQYLRASFKEIHGVSGDFVGWLWLFVDVTEIRLREQALRTEREMTRQLLHAILPAEVVPSMLRHGYVAPAMQRGVAVCFVDFVAFTRLTQLMPETELIGKLDHFFGAFDEIVNRYGLEKIKTIGDAYLFVAGVPSPLTHACERALLAALDIQALLRSEESAHGDVVWTARVGLHCGNVIAGIIGKNKFAYDIWGDTVNVASRIQGHAHPGGVAISRAVFDRVHRTFHCTHRGMVLAKNHDEVDVYDVDGVRDRDALLRDLHADRTRPFSRQSQVMAVLASGAYLPE